MSKTNILQVYEKSAKVNLLVDAIQKKDTRLQIKGWAGSSLSFIIKTAFEKSELPFLLLFQDKEEAAYYLNDLENLRENN